MPTTFKLSSVLYGHSLDVRSVVTTHDNSIVSGSRDKTAKLWVLNKIDTSYTPVTTYRDQKNFVIAVLYLEPTKDYPDGLVVTGGNDNIIYVYKPSEPFATTILQEHSNAVSCLSKASGENVFLSGSWDCTAKLWSLNKSEGSIITLSGHSAAVWAVIQLQDSRILTASADKTINVWNSEGIKLNSLKGHNDCVRGLLDLPKLQQFISISNDASIKLWSYFGENIDTYYGHTNYIYSIAHCKSAGENSFVTSDEDCTVRVWQNGVNVESFKVPAQSVWSVACLSNNDVVTGSSDGVVRIFTQDESRYADETTLKKFTEEVEAFTRQNQEIGGYKISDLPGKEALYDPGRKPGQMKMIREEHGVVAYTWVEDGDKSHWEKVGDVLGSANKNKQDKTMYEGQPYDFVFSVDVEDGKPPLKLPYNKGQDPYQAAYDFLAKNMLPSSYLEQIVDFILKNTQEQYVPRNNDYVDPFTGSSRYTPGSGGSMQGITGSNLDPFTGSNSYSTSSDKPTDSSLPNNTNTSRHGAQYFPINAYRTFEMGDSQVILSKLKEFNEKCGDGRDTGVSEHYLEELVKLCSGPPDDPNAFDILFKLLDWPDEIVFPAVDVVRMAVRHPKNNEIIASSNNGIIIQKLMNFVNENCKIPNNIIVALRTLCNLFTHEYGEELIFEHRFDVVENITALGSLNKNGQIALATLLLNLALVALKKVDDLGISILADVIPDILTKLSDPESQFRSYVALGTLLTSISLQQSLEVKSKIKSNAGFISAFRSHLLSGQSDLENKRQDCAQQVQNILSISF